MDLTQDDDTPPVAPAGATGAASPAAAAKPKRKRKAKAAAGDDAGAGPDTQPSPAVKKARQKAPKKEKEKRQNAWGRTVPWSAKPSQKVKERMARAMPGSGHRLFLISRKTVASAAAEGGPVEEFAVLGATGNAYTVKVGCHPSCSCPDHAKGNLCKHSLFVMLRVLRLAQDDPLVWQRALLKSEAEEVLSGSRSQRSADMDVHASEAVQRAWRAASGAAPAEVEDAAGSQKPQRAVDGECAICFDDLQDGASAAQRAIVTCESCGNHLHTECFGKWASAKRAQGLEVSCVYCRSRWADPAAAPGASAGAGAGGYVNLSHVSEAHRTSQSLNELYGATAVWINHHARGGNARHAASLYNQLRG